MGTIFFLLPSAVTTSSNVVSLRSNDPSLYFPLLHTHLSHQLSLHFYISSVAPLKTQPNPPWGNKPFFFLGGVFSFVFPCPTFLFLCCITSPGALPDTALLLYERAIEFILSKRKPWSEIIWQDFFLSVFASSSDGECCEGNLKKKKVVTFFRLIHFLTDLCRAFFHLFN